MAGCVGEPKGSPVSVPGYANPAQFATSSIGVVGGDNVQMYGVIVMTTQISVETLSPNYTQPNSRYHYRVTGTALLYRDQQHQSKLHP